MESDFEKIKDFTELKVWQMAHELKLGIYEFVKLLPESEKFNRVSQLKKAICSVSANIAEGFGRYHYQENIQFCRQARGSLDEARDYLITSRDLKEVREDKCNYLINKCIEVKKILNGYIRFLNNKKQQKNSN